jgi:hypothetical protein
MVLADGSALLISADDHRLRQSLPVVLRCPGKHPGRICIGRPKINLSCVFAGQRVGIKEVRGKTWLVSFMNYVQNFFS